ncbi:uncharacterized protein EDB91DRAFT_1079010 [Suillus paluster]|uniref:uncharacterized protein n=1 Tax=Suillus paluster TaxID=48578 RepID=UPI001B874FA1|nr:uncharacterized protein EDB91DRAFT_1079010 [Suillus paluster]KAG1748876.1 hypothetical protein EDB91DRAFT_1079010 [Suillus paluster]
MSNQANKSMADLKEITGQLLAIIRTARQIPPVQDHGDSTCLPGLVLSCLREFIRTRNCSPQEAPNWQSISHDDPRLMQHSWRSKALAWQALGDHSFDLTHEVDGGDTDNAPSPLMSVDGDALEKGKGKAREVEPEKEKEREKPKDEQEKPHRKRPFSQMLKPVPKSAMKRLKRGKSGQERKSRESVDSSDEEEEEDGSLKPRSDTPSVIVTRWVSPAQPSRPSGPPRSPGSPKKAPFGPGMVPKSNIQQTPPLMRPDIPESSQATSESPRDVPPVVDASAILIPGPHELPCTTRFDKRKGMALMSCVLCTTKKVKCISARLSTLASTTRGRSTECLRASSTGPSTSQSTGNPPKPRSRGRSKPLGLATMPIPPAAVIASSSSAAPHAAQDLPIPDLHWMLIAIRKSTNHIAALEAPTSVIPPPAATLSLLLDQASPGSQSHVHLAPLLLINFSTNSTGKEASTIIAPVMEPTIPPSQTEAALDPAPAIASTVPVDAVHSPADDGASTFASAFALPGPLEMHPSPLEIPEDGPSTAEIVEHGSPLNLLPEYDSGDEQDAAMQIVLNNQYRIPNIMQTSEPRACNKESQGPSPEHLGAQYSVFAFQFLILGSPSPEHLGARNSVFAFQLSILGSPTSIPQYLVWFLVLDTGSRYSVPGSALGTCTRYLTLGDQFAIPNPRYPVLSSRYLILAAQFDIPDPQHSVVSPQSLILGTRYSVPGSPSPALGTQYSFLGTPHPGRDSPSSILGARFSALST